MVGIAPAPSRDRGQKQVRLIAGAGVVILLISAAAALLPRSDLAPPSTVIAAMMVTAVLIEMMAGGLRSHERIENPTFFRKYKGLEIDGRKTISRPTRRSSEAW